jgi:hypothetical protein
MNLFFDEVVVFANENPGILELRALKASDVQKFSVSNIAAILPNQYARLELPSIAPPYPNLWFEWVTEQDPRLKFGVFLVSKKTEDGWDCTFFFFNVTPNQRSPVFFCPIGASFLIPPNGRFSEEALVEYFLIPSMEKTGEAITNFLVQFLVENFLALIFFTLGLLHCKNIVVEERGGLNLQTHSRRHRSKGTRHHVLQIMPGRETKRKVYEQQGKGSPHSLHFRRGHFKEYTAENPLFGKYTGVFWWEAHVAGQAEIGTVTKDYQLLPPKNGLGAPAR